MARPNPRSPPAPVTNATFPEKSYIPILLTAFNTDMSNALSGIDHIQVMMVRNLESTTRGVNSASFLC